MKEIRDIYYWNVEEELIAGATVYAVDKFANEVYCVNAISAEDYFYVMRECKTEPKKYAFWVVTKTEAA